MVVRIVLALVVGLGLMVGGYQGARALEASVVVQVRQMQVDRIQERARFRVGDLEQAIREAALFLTEREVNLMRFEPRLRVTHDDHPTFRAVAWLPLVQSADADEFLAQIRRKLPDFAIREMNPETGEVGPAGKALAYVPFLLVRPEHGNDGLTGIDLGNQPNLAEAMQLSYKIDNVSAAAASPLPPEEEPAILMLHYVRNPEGFVGGVVQVSTLLDHLMADAPEGLVGRLVDNTAGDRELAVQEGFTEGDQTVSGSVVVGGRRMVLDVAVTDAYRPLGLQLAPAVGFAGAGVTLVLLAMAILAAPKREE